MQQLFVWWRTYQAWAGSLDSEARCCIIGACIALLMVYVLIDIISPEVLPSSAKPAKTIRKKTKGDKHPDSITGEQSGQ